MLPLDAFMIFPLVTFRIISCSFSKDKMTGSVETRNYGDPLGPPDAVTRRQPTADSARKIFEIKI